MKTALTILTAVWLESLANGHAARVPPQIEQSCIECHDAETKKGGLDLTALQL